MASPLREVAQDRSSFFPTTANQFTTVDSRLPATWLHKEAGTLPTVPTPRRRCINMTVERSRMVANASAYLNISGEQFIQAAISSALMSLCEHDKVLSFILLRSGGIAFDDLAKVTP